MIFRINSIRFNRPTVDKEFHGGTGVISYPSLVSFDREREGREMDLPTHTRVHETRILLFVYSFFFCLSYPATSSLLLYGTRT